MTESPSLKYNRELTEAFKAKVGNPPCYPKVSEQVECLPLDTSPLPKFSYNPSVYRSAGQTWMTYRYHPGPDFTTRLGIAEIGEKWDVRSTQDLALGAGSCEDARLFNLQSEPWMSWVETDLKTLKGIVKYAKLERPAAQTDPKRPWKPARTYQIMAGSNDGSSMQKNWCFFESDENLFCIYESQPAQIVWHVQGEKVVNEYRSPAVAWPYGTIRGGSIVPYDGKLLRVFHSSTTRGIGKYEHRYFVGACLMNPKPPFATVAVSKKPIIYGSEDDSLTPDQRKACFHWRTVGKSVVFPGGLIQYGNGCVCALGVNDAACVLAKIKPEQLNL